MLVDLAWLRAAAPTRDIQDPAESIALAQHAATLVGGDHPMVLDALAAAYASAGRFELALTTARQALEQVRATAGLEQLVLEIEQRVSLYLTFRPYRLAAAESEVGR